MKFTTLLIALGTFISPNLFGQELLSDSTFLAGFEAKAISLKELKIKHNPAWMLIAGRTTKDTLTYTEQQNQTFRLFADSIEGLRADLYTYDKEICDSRCRIAKFECLKRNLQGKGDKSICDSISDICLEKCAEVKQVRDAMLDDSLERIWDTHEYQYNFHLQYAFTPSKKGISIHTHSDSLALCLAKGFATTFAPKNFRWLLTTKKRKNISIIDTNEKLLALLGPINNYPKAYLVLCAAGYTAPYTYPQDTFRLWAKQTDNGFYFMVPLQLPETSLDEFTGLVQVTKDGLVRLLEKR